MVLVAVLDVCQAEVMELPGANTSTQEPRLEKLARLVVAPTVMAVGARAGE